MSQNFARQMFTISTSNEIKRNNLHSNIFRAVTLAANRGQVCVTINPGHLMKNSSEVKQQLEDAGFTVKHDGSNDMEISWYFRDD